MLPLAKRKKHTFSSNIVVSQEFLIADYAAQKVQFTEFLAVLYYLNLQSQVNGTSNQ